LPSNRYRDCPPAEREASLRNANVPGPGGRLGRHQAEQSWGTAAGLGGSAKWGAKRMRASRRASGGGWVVANRAP
jgi:hypothetical protein